MWSSTLPMCSRTGANGQYHQGQGLRQVEVQRRQEEMLTEAVSATVAIEVVGDVGHFQHVQIPEHRSPADLQFLGQFVHAETALGLQ